MFCKNCITAKKKFRKGDKVILSVEGCRQVSELIQNKSVGLVTGFGLSYNCVRVLINGQTRSSTWHCGFWERI